MQRDRVYDHISAKSVHRKFKELAGAHKLPSELPPAHNGHRWSVFHDAFGWAAIFGEVVEPRGFTREVLTRDLDGSLE